MRRVLACRFGDVDGEIADPLEIGVDLDRGDNGAEVNSHRLVQRKQSEATIVDFDVQGVQRLVADEDALDQFVIAIDQPFHGETDLFFGDAAHLEQPGFELFEFLLEMTDDAVRMP